MFIAECDGVYNFTANVPFGAFQPEDWTGVLHVYDAALQQLATQTLQVRQP